MIRPALLLCLAAALLAGCAQTRTSGTVHEAARIAPGDKIAVLWTAGLFVDPFIHERMVKDGTYGKQYETCTNAWIERTFGMNGYPVSARKVAAGEQPVVPRDVRYVLAISNTMARTTRQNNMGAPLGFGLVILEMQLDLRDRSSRKSFWSGTDVFFTDPRRNAATVLRVVRALAADGYLDVKPENVVDSSGKRAEPDGDALPDCPG